MWLSAPEKPLGKSVLSSLFASRKFGSETIDDASGPPDPQAVVRIDPGKKEMTFGTGNGVRSCLVVVLGNPGFQPVEE